MSISKQYLKTKPACKVTFKLTADRLPAAKQVALLGEFNNWDPEAVAYLPSPVSYDDNSVIRI